METAIRLVAIEFGTSPQSAPKPAEVELVCAWRRQPRWSAGQERVRQGEDGPHGVTCPTESVTGVVLTTRRVPSVARVLVFQPRLWPGLEGVSIVNAPL